MTICGRQEKKKQVNHKTPKPRTMIPYYSYHIASCTHSHQLLHTATTARPSVLGKRVSIFCDGSWGLAKTPACTSVHCGFENACSVQDASDDTVNSTCFRFQARRAERPDRN